MRTQFGDANPSSARTRSWAEHATQSAGRRQASIPTASVSRIVLFEATKPAPAAHCAVEKSALQSLDRPRWYCTRPGLPAFRGPRLPHGIAGRWPAQGPLRARIDQDAWLSSGQRDAEVNSTRRGLNRRAPAPSQAIAGPLKMMRVRRKLAARPRGVEPSRPAWHTRLGRLVPI